MGKTITRQALYDAVWAQPITKLSKDFGISDVGLAKACRKLSVPLPPRGYWARKAAGKPALQVALPPRPPGLSEKTTIGGGGHTWGWRMPSDEVFLGDIPPPPSFDEPIEEVRVRIEAMIGKTAIVQRDLEHPHPVVAKLLHQDSGRRAKNAGRTYVGLWDQVLYDTPIQQRRLRLLSSILMTAGRCGCRGDFGMRPEMGQPQNQFSLVVGDQRVGFRVAAEESKPPKRGKVAEKRAATSLSVKLDDQVWDDVQPGEAVTVRNIAIALVLSGEVEHRERAVSGHHWLLEQHTAIIERREKEAAEAARREREHLAELERKRVERLLSEAEALRNARAIRSYVEEVRSASPSISPTNLDAWASWALTQADMIDPILSGAFLRNSELD